jgi:hypothetical protein
MLQTDKQGHTGNMAMLKSRIFTLSFPERHSLRFLYYRTVCVCPPAAGLSRYMTSYFWRPPKHRTFQFHTISNNNMADTRIFEAVATRASLTWRKSINIYRSWNIVHCVRWCISKLQGEGKVTVQLSEEEFVLEWKSRWMNVLLNWHWTWRVHCCYCATVVSCFT